MGPITAIIPVPRRCTLGGVPVLVSEARLRDMAELQGYLDDEAPDPLGCLLEIAGDADQSATHRRLVQARKLAKEGPQLYGSADTSLRQTNAGIAFFLWVALKRHQPEMTAECVVALSADMTAAEFDRIYRVFHGTKPLRLLDRLLLGPGGDDYGRTLTWGEAIDRVARDRGWTYPDVYNLSLTEWRNALRDGEPERYGRRLRDGETLEEALESRRQALGED